MGLSDPGGWGSTDLPLHTLIDRGLPDRPRIARGHAVPGSGQTVPKSRDLWRGVVYSSIEGPVAFPGRKQMRSRNSLVSSVLFTSLVVATTVLAQGAPDLLWTKGGHLGVLDVAISPDRGTLVSIGQDDQSVKLWNAADGRLIRTLPAQQATGESIAYSPDGQYVASGGDVNFGSGEVNVKLWRVSDGSLVRTFGNAVTDVQTAWSLAFSPDGTLLAV